MAACDNLNGNRKEWIELRDFLYANNPYALMYMKPIPKHVTESTLICYIPDIQEWLIENCPFKWVQERLIENFEMQRMILGTAYHESENET